MYTFLCTWAQGGSPFFWLLSFFCSYVPVSIILICISFVNCQIFISGHYWISILCYWHSLVWCDTASLWHFSQFHYLDEKMYLGRWLFSFLSLSLAVPPCHNSSLFNQNHIKPFPFVSFIHEQLTWKNKGVWICTIKVSSSSCFVLNCLYELTHTNCTVITYYTSYNITIDIIIAHYMSWSYTYEFVQSLVRACLYEFGQFMLTVQLAISQLFSTYSHTWICSIIS